ncbi:MAG: regulatory protein RecX [Varibaculum sp.]|nr:regulatory protein RecX [Varibaculum sp.]
MVKYIDPQFEDTSIVRKRRPPDPKRREVRRERMANLGFPEAVERAHEDALNRLDRADMSTATLRRKLQGVGYRDEVISEVLQRLTRVGLIDDEAYGQRFLRSRFNERGLVGVALQQQARLKGIPDEVVAHFLAELDSGEVEQRARRLVSGWLRGSRPLNDPAPDDFECDPEKPPPDGDYERRYRKLTNMLYRRGYPSSLAATLVREYLGEH